MLRRKTLLTVLALLTVLGTTPAAAQFRDPADAPVVPGNDSSVRTTPYRYTSDEGNFMVTWPSGCGKLRIRANEPEVFEGETESSQILVNHVSCDQFGVEGEGCSVTATFDARSADGGPAGPDQVLARVRNALKTYGVTIVKQTPVRREYPDGLVVEGIDITGTGPDGKGQFQVRGLLAYHDIYVLTAWSVGGRLWSSPEYQEFFNEFQPFIE